MRLRIDWKSFAMGVGALFIGLVVPVVSDTLISLVTSVRDALPFSKKK